MTSDGDPDTAAELRLIRAEIAAIGRQVIREQETREHASPPRPHPRPAWLPGLHDGRLTLPVRHYQLTSWIGHRSKTAVLPRSHVSRQRRTALWLLVFAAARTFVWLVAMALIVAHWAGASGPFLHWFTSLSATVIFVTFISFYCNASTDAANLSASLAALFSADSHAAVITGAAAENVTGRELAEDVAAIGGDIARLADLQPGPEASALSASIRARLAVP